MIVAIERTHIEKVYPLIDGVSDQGGGAGEIRIRT
jgi:hypothetical protein